MPKAICHPVVALPPPRLLLQDKPCQLDAPKPIKVPKELNLLLPRMNETLTGVKTNKFRDVTYVKYKLVTPRVIIDGVRAALEQVKVMPPKKKKRVPSATQDNDGKRQQMTVMLLDDKIQNIT